MVGYNSYNYVHDILITLRINALELMRVNVSIFIYRCIDVYIPKIYKPLTS